QERLSSRDLERLSSRDQERRSAATLGGSDDPEESRLTAAPTEAPGGPRALPTTTLAWGRSHDALEHRPLVGPPGGAVGSGRPALPAARLGARATGAHSRGARVRGTRARRAAPRRLADERRQLVQPALLAARRDRPHERRQAEGRVARAARRLGR